MDLNVEGWYAEILHRWTILSPWRCSALRSIDTFLVSSDLWSEVHPGFCCTPISILLYNVVLVSAVQHEWAISIRFPPSWASLSSLYHTDISLCPLILTLCPNCSPRENVLLLPNLAADDTRRPLGPAISTCHSLLLESCLVSRTSSFLLGIGDRFKR